MLDSGLSGSAWKNVTPPTVAIALPTSPMKSRPRAGTPGGGPGHSTTDDPAVAERVVIVLLLRYNPLGELSVFF